MTPEEKDLLEKTYRLTADNNDMIRRLYRSYKFGRYAKIAYWVVIILLSFGAYYLIQPYLQSITNAGSGIQAQVNGIQSFTDSLKSLTN